MDFAKLWSNDHDAFLAALDLSSKTLPRSVSGDALGLRPLAKDKEHIAHGIGPKFGRGRKILRKRFAVPSIERRHELLDRLIL